MPRVPYQPFSTATPTGGAERVSVSTPPEAFGVNIGHALSAIGSTTEQVGSELFGRAIALQDLRNEADARDAQTQYATQASELHAQYGALEGKAAADGLQGYLKSQNDLRLQIRGGLKTLNAQRMYDSDTLPFMQRNIFSAASHAADENKKFVIGTATSQMDIDAKTFVNPKSEPEFDDKIERIKGNAATVAAAKGWQPGGPEEQDFIMQRQSHLRMAQITQVAHDDPQHAMGMLEKYKGDLVQDDFDKATDIVRSQNRAVGSVNLANSVYSPDKSFAQMEQEIKDKSPALAHNDPLFEKDAITALRGKAWNDRYTAAQDLHNTVSEVWDGIMKGNPSNVQELRAMPGMAAKIDSLPPEKQKDIPGWINSYSQARDKQSHDVNYTTLSGMAINDPEQFLNADLTKFDLSQSQIRSLMQKRATMLKNPADDPRLPRALGWMRSAHGSELNAMGIRLRTSNNQEEYDHYTGALESAIDTWTQERGKPPSYHDVVNEIGPQVIKQRAGNHWWNSQRPFFDQDLPQGWGDDLKSQGATDEEVYRAYVRSLFIQLYSKEGDGGRPVVPQSK